jgi:hypothetical protein
MFIPHHLWLDSPIAYRWHEAPAMRMNTTLVINSKGGSGKTTVATNLASYFSANDIVATIMDYDPQGSSLNWLRLRPPTGTRLYGANAAPQKGSRLRSIEMHGPADSQELIIDAPASASGLLLQEMLGSTDFGYASAGLASFVSMMKPFSPGQFNPLDINPLRAGPRVCTAGG